jgi:hypothetical protein
MFAVHYQDALSMFMVAACCDMLPVVTTCPSHPIISTTESLLTISEVAICALLTIAYYKLTRAN